MVERRPRQSTRMTKPRFVLRRPQGRDYLAAAREKALFPEISQQQDWSARESGGDIQQALAEFVRQLPEFRDSDESRIRENAAL